MKAWIKICLCIGISLLGLTGCQKDKILKPKQETFQIELGNKIPLEAKLYLNFDGLTAKQTQDIERNSIMSLQKSNQSHSYEDVGIYQAQIKYQGEVLEFPIEVIQTRAPIILGPNTLYLQQGQQYDFQEKYRMICYSELKETKFDSSNIDIHKVGTYSLIIKAMTKDNQLSSQRNITVHVQKKVHSINKKTVFIDVPYYNQMDVNAPNGCEATALYMALKYKRKVNIELVDFIRRQPRSQSPYFGFSGDPFGIPSQTDDYYTIFPTPLMQYAKDYGGLRDISGSHLSDLRDELANDHPVIVWVTGNLKEPQLKTYYFGQAVKNLHIVLVNGYDMNKEIFYIQDPMNRELKEVSFQEFALAYNAMKFAICVE